MNKQARSEKIIAAFVNGRTAQRSGRLERVRDGKRLVFTAEPDYIRNSAGEIIGVDAWVELYDASGNEIPIDPHRRIINPPTVPRSGADDPVEAFFEAVFDSVDDAPNPQGWRTAGTVTTIYGDTTDGRIEGQSATYSAARQGTGNLNLAGTGVTAATGQFFSSTYSCYQQYWAFNTSAITDTDDVTDVQLQLWMVSDQSVSADYVIEAREKNWGPTLTTADYTSGSTLASHTLMASLNTSGIGAVGYKTFTSTADFLTASGLKTGTVYLFTSSSRQRTGTAATGDEFVQFSHAETTGTTQDPKLVITHSSVTSVSNSFDGGTHNTTITAANSGGSSGTAFTQVVGTPRYSNAVSRSGSLSAVNPVAGTDGHVDYQNIVNGNVLYSRFYLYLTGSLTVGQRLFVLIDEDSAFPYSLVLGPGRELNLQYHLNDGALYTFSNLIPLNQWVRIETKAVMDSTGSGDAEVWLYLDPNSDIETETSSNFNGAWGTGSPRTAEFGLRREASGYWHLDDVAVATSKIGPGATFASGGSSTSITVTSSAAGAPGGVGGSSASVTVVELGAGSPGPSAGASTSVSVTSSASGAPGVASGSSSALSVTLSAGGSPGLQAGSGVSVSVAATGAGEASSDASGGSSAVVQVSVTGAGSVAFSGGSSAVVETVVTGAGELVIVDITIVVGPTVVRSHYSLGESRTSYSAEDNRLSVSAGDNQLRERVQVASSTVREPFTVGETRQSVEIGENRLGLDVDPSRVTRME